MKSSDLVVVSTFRSTPDAEIAKGILRVYHQQRNTRITLYITHFLAIFVAADQDMRRFP